MRKKRAGAIDADVLALQEVDSIEALEEFIDEEWLDDYRHLVLVEGNDQRLIDVALMSKLPIGAVTSWRHRTYKNRPRERPIFSRDLLEAEILDERRKRVLFTLFVNHLKSKLATNEAQRRAGNRRRRRQAQTIADILGERTPGPLPRPRRHERPPHVGDAPFAPRARARERARLPRRDRWSLPTRRPRPAEDEGVDAPSPCREANRLRALRSDMALARPGWEADRGVDPAADDEGRGRDRPRPGERCVAALAVSRLAASHAWPVPPRRVALDATLPDLRRPPAGASRRMRGVDPVRGTAYVRPQATPAADGFLSRSRSSADVLL
jgi:hypothetical protein